MREKLVICLTGMPGAGKSVIAEVGERYGFKVFRMGDDVRLEAERRGLEPNDDNLGKIMLELREKSGPTAIAALCKARIEREANSVLFTIDGLRSIPEFEEFKKLGVARLVAVHASPEKRFQFLRQRGREDSPDSIRTFGQRDERELSIGVGEVVAISDEVIPNSGSLEELKARAAELFQRQKRQFDEEELES